MPTKKALVFFVLNDHLKEEMVMIEYFSNNRSRRFRSMKHAVGIENISSGYVRTFTIVTPISYQTLLLFFSI
jgi:hypothetical protein